MSTVLKRRLQRLEQAAGKGKRTRGTTTLIEPAADASDELWRQFAIRKAEAEAEASGGTLVVIRAGHPVRPIDYRCRVAIVPPKIPAMIDVRPLPMEGNAHAH